LASAKEALVEGGAERCEGEENEADEAGSFEGEGENQEFFGKIRLKFLKNWRRKYLETKERAKREDGEHIFSTTSRINSSGRSRSGKPRSVSFAFSPCLILNFDLEEEVGKEFGEASGAGTVRDLAAPIHCQ